MKSTCDNAVPMTDLLAALIDKPVCVWFAGRAVDGVLRGVGDGFVCVDIDDVNPVRTFIPLTAITALRSTNVRSTGEAL
jgi:hypothetical protein